MSSKTSTTHPLSGQVAESPILIRQRTNHAGRLLLLTGAPGCPTGSTTGLLQWDSLQRSLVHGSGRFNYSPSQNKQYRPGKATGHPTHARRSRKRQKRIQVAKPHHRIRRRETKEEKLEKRSPWGRRDSPGLSHLSKQSSFLAKRSTSNN